METVFDKLLKVMDGDLSRQAQNGKKSREVDYIG